MLQNETFGSLVRTKGNHENEGGVAAGYAVIDSPVIVPELKPVGDSKTHFKALNHF